MTRDGPPATGFLGKTIDTFDQTMLGRLLRLTAICTDHACAPNAGPCHIKTGSPSFPIQASNPPNAHAPSGSAPACTCHVIHPDRSPIQGQHFIPDFITAREKHRILQH
jgi:hypothetical protein